MTDKTILKQAPKIGKAQIDLLRRLSEASGVSGDEDAVRKIVLEEVRKITDQVRIDPMGSVIVTRKGKGENNLKVLAAAHMDEVGLMVTADDGDGLFQFRVVGGIDVRYLPGKPVWVGADRVPGVIGARAIHLTTAEERKHAIPLNTLRIDVGPGDAAKKVKPGDRAVFAVNFLELSESLRGKAMDDRIGVTNLIELLKHAPDNIDLVAAFTVQEEVGLRGAQAAAYAEAPDIAFALDCTPCNDLPTSDDSENTRYNARAGAGAVLYTMDRGTISDPRLVKHIRHIGDTHGIKYQVRQAGSGATDAAAMHKQRAGIPSVSISVPGRNMHNTMTLVRKEDWDSTLQLIYAVMATLNRDVLKRDE